MNKIRYTILATAMLAFLAAGCTSESKPEKPQRKIAVQTYTLRKNTLEESLPMLKSIGVDALGCSAGQEISRKFPKVKFNPSMNAEQRAFVKKLLADNGFKIASYGVYTPKTDADSDKLFAFCKEMNIPAIITEAKPERLPYMNELGKKYNIRVCIHNHGKDSKANNYYDPNVVWNLIKDSEYLYACPDNGHWARSGIRPIDGYKILRNKMNVIHFKDQRTFGNIKNENVPHGEGALEIEKVLKYLDSVGYDGYLVIENENIADDPMPVLKKSVDFLRSH